MQRCGDIMTNDPACCVPGDTVDRAANLMKTRNVGPVPVVDEQAGRRLLGIVTDRDLALKVVAEGRDAKRTRVEDVMTRGVVTCRADDDVQKCLDVMSEHQLRRVPVLDRDNRLVGMIAQADVATSMMEPQRVADVVKEISRPERVPHTA